MMKEFVDLRLRMYSYLTDDGCVDKKAKGTKKFVIKKEIKFKNCKFLESNKTMLRSQQRFRSELHNVFTRKINKVVLGTNDDKRIQTADAVTACSYVYEC